MFRLNRKLDIKSSLREKRKKKRKRRGMMLVFKRGRVCFAAGFEQNAG